MVNPKIIATLSLSLIALLVWKGERNFVIGTIDVNLPELEYLAARLEPKECRRLVAALHYDSYELPVDLWKAERKVDKSISCSRHLLHWNSSEGEGKGRTHELLERRLRQLGRKDLADWLGKTVFKELGKDLHRLVVDEPFGELAVTDEAPMINATESESTNATTITTTTEKPIKEEHRDENEKLWLIVDMIVVGLFATFLFVLVLLVGTSIIIGFARCKRAADAYAD